MVIHFGPPEANHQRSLGSWALSRAGTLTTMPTVRQQRPKRFNYRALPLWLQWVLPFGIAVIAVVALVVYVHHQTNDTPSEAPVNSPSAVAAQTQQDDALMRQEQAPQTTKLKPGVAPAEGLKAVMVSWLDQQIKKGKYGGPLQSAGCTPTAGSTTARAAFECGLVTANVTYHFYGVVIPGSGRVTFCQKVSWPPVYGMPHVKLSKSCLAG